MVQSDRQQPNAGTARRCRFFSRRAFHDFNDSEGYAAVRGRLGIAFDRFLAFGTAGWAWGNPLMSYALTGAAPFVNNGGSSTGWTAGLGVDYAFTNSVFGRIEYRYTSLGTSAFVSTATNSAATSDRLPISDLRAGIAYKFGGRSDAIQF
jgi:outer membrane immunogenic protein